MKKLSDHDLDEISELAAKSVENFIYSKVSKKEVINLDIKVELDYHDGLDVDIQVDIQFDPLSKPDKQIAEDATAHAIKEVDSYMADS